MPAKFYYVLAFREGDIPLLHADTQPHFLGKTSDLSFKTEPDKTLDLDDGSTEVGSEKLSLSFSILGAIDNPWPIGEVWLVPAISDGIFAPSEFPPGSVLRVYLRDADDYRIETKSGEFELTRFSASLRYAADAPAYGYYDLFFKYYQIHLFPNINDADARITIERDDEQDDEQKVIAVDYGYEDRLIHNQLALISSYIVDSNISIKNRDQIVVSLDPRQKGIFIHRKL